MFAQRFSIGRYSIIALGFANLAASLTMDKNSSSSMLPCSIDSRFISFCLSNVTSILSNIVTVDVR
jgi:hypothetical protein